MQGWIWQEQHHLDSVINWSLADLSYYCYSFCAICPAYWLVSPNAGYVKGTVNKKLLIVGFSTPVKEAYCSWVAVNWCLLMLNLKPLLLKDRPLLTYTGLHNHSSKMGEPSSPNTDFPRRVQSRWVLISAGSHTAALRARAAVQCEANSPCARQAGGPAGSTGLFVKAVAKRWCLYHTKQLLCLHVTKCVASIPNFRSVWD